MRDWSDAEPDIERVIFRALAGGRTVTASYFWKSARARHKNAWPSLLRLEKKGLIWRAFDYEDWRTLHQWKMTGCGILLYCTPNAETVAALKEADSAGGEIWFGPIEELFDDILNDDATSPLTSNNLGTDK